MNRKPVLLRTCIAVVVLLVFIWSMFPLREQNFYETLEKMASKKDAQFTEMIELAKKLETEKGLYAFGAVEQAVIEKNIDLTKYISLKGLESNRDVLSQVRKKCSSSIRLGLDLNGGVEFILGLSPDEKLEKEKEKEKENLKEGEKPLSFEDNFNRYRDIAIETIRRRIEDRKIYESEMSPSGEKFISLRVPVVSREEKKVIEDLIKMSAKLEFRMVHENNASLVAQYLADPKGFKGPSDCDMLETVEFVERDGKGNEIKNADTGKVKKKKEGRKQIYFVYKRPEMTGKNIVDASPMMDQFGQRQISLSFNSQGTGDFAEVTTLHTGRNMAIVLDGKLYCAPTINEAITGGRAQISGDFSSEEVNAISNALVNGSLPVKINVEAVFETSPTLGKEALHNGLLAGIITTIAICLFMLVYYRRAGFVANIALIANIFIMLGALAAFECTLTLPGIAGLVLTVGMAVDANVLIYERIREELAKNKTVWNAIELGYGRAFTTILDSNLTTLFVGLILYWVGTGPIKGFAITLCIGIVTSMFTALFLTRLIFDIMGAIASSKSENFLIKMLIPIMSFRTLPMMKFFERPNFDFMRMRYVAMILSGILILASIATMAVRGWDMLGIDFTGGSQILMDIKGHIPETEIKKVLATIGYADAKVGYKTTSIGGADTKKLEIILSEKSIEKSGAQRSSLNADIAKVLGDKFKDAGFKTGEMNTIGGLVGRQFATYALWAVFLSFLSICAYVSLRFEFSYSLGGIIALLHDTIIATGILLLCGREISMPVVAALLTIIGFSINDTIVVFDRIREELTLNKNKSYKDVINLSINETLSRTILTSFTVFIAVMVLYLAGGVELNDFALVMMIGVLVGTYSSVFIASPIVLFWHKDHEGDRALAKN